jgi:hypothetical protein
MNASERWFVPELQSRPIATRQAHVRNPLTGATLELSSGEHAVLAACEGCLTLDEHVAAAARKLAAPAEHRPAFRDVIERGANAGLLMPLPALLARADAADARRTTCDVAIRTCDRSASLARLLASAVRLEARGGARRRWLVFDDSREPASEAANRAAVEACGLDATYAGGAQGAKLEASLADAFPQGRREIAWLLGAGGADEATYGRPLNHALLTLAGRSFLAIDDDVVLEPHAAAVAEAGFAVDDHADELRCYGSEDALWRDCPPLDLDPLATHESWLKMPLAAAWARAEREAGALAEIDLRPHHGARFAPDARILFTHSHACGDPGSALLPLQLLTLPARSRRWLAGRPEAASEAFTQRISWRGQPRLRLAPRRILTFTTLAGLDNSRLLPPAARSHRSEDVLLGLAAQCVHPSAWFVDLPFGLPHLRATAKQWLPSASNVMQEPLHVIYAWIDENAKDVAARSAEDRLAAMGEMLLGFARMSDTALADALWLHAADAGSRTLFAIEEQLDDATLPEAWKAGLRPWLRSPALAVDDASVRGRVLAPQALRPVAEAYGRALHMWPRLWHHCRERNI